MVNVVRSLAVFTSLGLVPVSMAQEPAPSPTSDRIAAIAQFLAKPG